MDEKIRTVLSALAGELTVAPLAEDYRSEVVTAWVATYIDTEGVVAPGGRQSRDPERVGAVTRR